MSYKEDYPGSTGYGRSSGNNPSGFNTGTGYGSSHSGSEGSSSSFDTGSGWSTGGFASGTLLAFLLGAAAGAAVALLTSPRTGREMRENLRSWANTAKDRAMDMAQRAQQTAGVNMGQGPAGTAGTGRAGSDIPPL